MKNVSMTMLAIFLVFTLLGFVGSSGNQIQPETLSVTHADDADWTIYSRRIQ